MVNSKNSSKKGYTRSLEEVEMILDNIPGLVFYKDDKNNLIRVNKYFADAHKTTKEALAGKNCFDIYPKDVAQKYFDDDLEVIKSKKPKLNFIEPWDLAEGRRWVNSNKIPLYDDDGKCIGIIGFSTDVTTQVKAEQSLRGIEWLLETKKGQEQTYKPSYGNLTELNTDGILINMVGEDILIDIVRGYLDLLETSAAIYEKNGNYAVGIFSSGWCQFVDRISRNLCETNDNIEALKCGKWLCHESCWTEASKVSIETGQPVDVECHGGLHLYAVPIIVGGEPIGSINIGYGDPPKDPQKLQDIAEKYKVSVSELRELAEKYESRPPFIIDIAKKRIITSAKLISNIVERKKMEEELSATNQIFNAILSNVSICAIRIDEDGTYTQALGSGFKKWGFIGSELVGVNALEKFPQVSDKIKRVLSGERVEYIDGGIINGKPVYFQNYLFPDTHTGNGLIGINIDITDLKVAEQRLKESEEWLSTTFKSIGDAVITTDTQGNVSLLNPVAESLTGWKHNEAIEKPIEKIFNIINEETRKTVENPISRVIQEGIIVGLANHTILISKDGKEIPIADSGAPIKGIKGDIIGVVLVFRDITERKKAEKAIADFVKFLSENPNPVLRVTKEKVIYTNKHSEKIFNTHEGSEVPAVLREILVKAFDANKTISTEISLNNHIFSLDITPIREEEYANVYGRDITERKQAEEALKKSEEQYRTLFESAEVGMYRSTLDGSKVLAVNQKISNILGITKEEILSNPAFIRWENPANRDEMMRKLREDGYVRDYEVRLKTAGDEIKTVVISGNLMPEKGWFEGSLMDITKRKKAEEKEHHKTNIMNAINELFQNALTCENVEELGKICLEVAQELSGAKFGFFGEVNKDGKFDSYAISNPGWDACKMPDSEATKIIKGMEIRGMQFLPLIDGKSRIFNDPSNHPDSVGTPKGHPKITCLLVVPFKYKGKIIGQIGLGNKPGGFNHHDQEAIEALSIVMIEVLMYRRAEDKLRESEERFRMVFESKLIGTIFWNVEGDIIEANDTFLGIVGYTRDEILNGIVRWRDMTPPEYYEQDTKLLEELAVKGVITPFEKEYYHKDGTRVPILLGAATIPGPTLNGVAFVIDITEKKKAEEKLNKLLKDLKSSNAELEQFAYVASHDLQEPLRMVASFTQLLRDRYQDKLDDDANDFINFAVDGATRMQNLISDLLIFSRVGSRGKPFKVTDMNIVLEAVLNNLRQLINETDSVITSDPLPVIEADESQMIQLFQNLISNGIKFRGKKDPIIHVTAETKTEKWIFSVKDNGIGMESKYFDRIFVIFQRLHKKDEYGGTGIGLAVCKKITQRHNGKIWVESKLGKGSTFYFSIPKKNKLDTMKSENRDGIDLKKLLSNI